MNEDLGKSGQIKQEDDLLLEAFELALSNRPFNYGELTKVLVQANAEQRMRLMREHAETLAALERLRAAAGKHVAEKHVAREAPKPISPPRIAAFVLSFLAPRNSAQAFLGDLEEMFQKNVERLGEKQACRMYWMQVAASGGPLLWHWVKRGFFTVLIGYFRSKLGL